MENAQENDLRNGKADRSMDLTDMQKIKGQKSSQELLYDPMIHPQGSTQENRTDMSTQKCVHPRKAS